MASRSSLLPPWSYELAIRAELEGDLKGRFSGAVGEASIVKKKVASVPCPVRRLDLALRRELDHVRLVISSYSGLPASLVSY
jgi:hypothetical protein